MFLKELFIKIRAYFYQLFNPVIFNLDEEYADILEKRNEFKKRNVLVGTIRRREQLSLNLAHKFYHIPLAELITPEDIEYVAIYQSKNLFHQNTDVNGITYFGKVVNVQIVKRCDIHEIPSRANELYARFDVECWQKIEPHIQIREISPQVCLKTSFCQLSQARFTNELFFKTAEEYVFFLGILDIINKTYDGFELGKWHVTRRGKRISVIKNGKTKLYPLKDFTAKIYCKINEIFEIE